METCITIPIYKETPSQWERESFYQCMSVLHKHDICIITHEELNLVQYKTIMNKAHITCNIEYFDKSYFGNLLSYNKLMMSYDFYNRFRNYKYILIYQLDAWVFKDSLDYWCAKKYDYIGAPWYKDFEYSHHDGNIDSLMVGNGGFPLRKVSSFINLFEQNKRVKSVRLLYKETNFSSFFSVAKFFLHTIGYNNHLKTYIRYHYNRLFEDQFYTQNLSTTNCKLNIAPVSEAIFFSFEQGPSYLFKHTNQNLPFGCHAFEKNEFLDFWSQHIKPKNI